MKNVRHLFNGIAFFLLLSCAPAVSNVNALQTTELEKPSWVSSKPASSFYYVGIGYSQKNRENYLQSSKQNALDDLISEIRVNISSVSVLNQMDDKEGFSEQYEAIIKTTASDDVEGYELVDTWEGDGQYWTYYRLSKEKYRKRKATKRNNALDLATDNYLKANQLTEKGEIASGLTLYINGLYTMAPYLGESNEIIARGDSILLGNALYNSIQNTFNDLIITTEKEQYVINRRLSKDESVEVMVRTKSENNQVSEFPLMASFSTGAGKVNPEYTTDEDGVATILISSITSQESKQVIIVMPDIDKLIPENIDTKKFGLLLKGLQLPQRELHFQIQKPVVYLESVEKRLGEPVSNSQISDQIKKTLSEEGFVFGRVKDEADLWVEVAADTEKGKASGSIYITYFNLNINVIDITTGAEIHHAGIDRLKAYSLNYERSSQSGYNKALEVLEKETLPKLIEEILR